MEFKDVKFEMIFKWGKRFPIFGYLFQNWQILMDYICIWSTHDSHLSICFIVLWEVYSFYHAMIPFKKFHINTIKITIKVGWLKIRWFMMRPFLLVFPYFGNHKCNRCSCMSLLHSLINLAFRFLKLVCRCNIYIYINLQQYLKVVLESIF